MVMKNHGKPWKMKKRKSRPGKVIENEEAKLQLPIF